MKNEEWKEYRLSDICDVRDGTHDSPKQSIDGKYLITSKHIKNGRIDKSSAYKISLNDFNFVNQRSKVDKWDILISMIGTVGDVCLVSEEPDFAIKNVGLIKTGNKDLANFLYYYLKSPLAQNNIASRLKGTTQQYLSLGEIRNFPIHLPSLSTQQKIAKILSALDDKIELNNAINRNLEEQAQALFKNWFVDFEPFGSEKPDDWQIGKLSDIAEYEKQKINISELTEETYYSTENMLPNRGGICRAANLPSIDQTTKCFPGETIISNIRPYFKKIFYCTEEIAGCSTDVLCFKPKKKTLEAYNYFLLCSDNFFDYMIKGTKGTKMPRGDKSQIMNYEVNIPSENMLQKFEAIASPILQQIKANQQENRHLAAVRDELLPKLMLGELDIADVRI